MQIYDYSKMADGSMGTWGVPTERLYHEGDGVQFRHEQRRGDLLQETVRIADNAFLLASDYVPLASQAHRQIVGDTSWVHIQFRFSGGGSEKTGNYTVDTPEKSCVLSRYPRNAQIERSMETAERWKYVCLFASPRALGGLLDVPVARMPQGAAWLVDEDSDRFESHCIGLRSSMAIAANDVLSCRLRGDNRRIYMRAKALELIAAAMESLKDENDAVKPKLQRLSAADFDRIVTARAIMMEDLEANLTLAALARRVGLNRTKLALGFKELYGVSVQAYWRDTKLSKAVEMLRDADMPVTEVAFSLGYAELSSFTRAFSRKFGMLPRHCRRERA